MAFILDTAGDAELNSKTQLLEEHDKPYFVDREEKTKALLSLFEKKKEELDEETFIHETHQEKIKASKVDAQFIKFYADMRWTANILMKSRRGRVFHFEQMDMETGKLKSDLGAVNVAEEMKKSVIQPDFEQQHVLPSYHTSARKLKAEKKKEKEKTKGPEWFNLPAPEVTEEMQNDLQVLKMRSVLDPKRFYKKNDMEALPKYFQVGKVMDSPLDHMNQRLTKAQRKRTMVDELLADADFQKYNKKKYKEIIDDKRKSVYKNYMKTKRQRNKAEIKRNKMIEALRTAIPGDIQRVTRAQLKALTGPPKKKLTPEKPKSLLWELITNDDVEHSYCQCGRCPLDELMARRPRYGRFSL